MNEYGDYDKIVRRVPSERVVDEKTEWRSVIRRPSGELWVWRKINPDIIEGTAKTIPAPEDTDE